LFKVFRFLLLSGAKEAVRMKKPKRNRNREFPEGIKIMYGRDHIM
jgi:hypothetical protein